MNIFPPKYGSEPVKLMCSLFVSLHSLVAQKLSCAKLKALNQRQMWVCLTPLLMAFKRYWWKFLCPRLGSQKGMPVRFASKVGPYLVCRANFQKPWKLKLCRESPVKKSSEGWMLVNIPPLMIYEAKKYKQVTLYILLQQSPILV